MPTATSLDGGQMKTKSEYATLNQEWQETETNELGNKQKNERWET